MTKLQKQSSVPVNLWILIILTLFISNIGLLYALRLRAKGATTCVTAAEVRAYGKCLLLSKVPNTNPIVYRVMNPYSGTSKTSGHHGHACQQNGIVANSTTIYDASNDFFGTGNYKSVHGSFIDFTTFLPKSVSTVPYYADICSNVAITPGTSANGYIATLVDSIVGPTSTPIPTLTSIPTLTPRPTATMTPIPTQARIPNISPTVTRVPTSLPTITSTPSCPGKNLGNANCDSNAGIPIINGIDYSKWLNSQCHAISPQTCASLAADFNNDKNVDDIDFDIWIVNRN